VPTAIADDDEGCCPLSCCSTVVVVVDIDEFPLDAAYSHLHQRKTSRWCNP